MAVHATTPCNGTPSDAHTHPTHAKGGRPTHAKGGGPIVSLNWYKTQTEPLVRCAAKSMK